MMKSEFDEKLGKESKDIDWEAIETCYMWHPAFDRKDAKKVAVELYKMMGVRPFLEMYDTALKARVLERECEELRVALQRAEDKLNEFKSENS